MNSTVFPSLTKTTIWSNRNFLLLWTGQTISLLGDAIFDLALVVWIVTTLLPHTIWTPLAASGILVAETLPVLLIGPLAGVFVDRWDKRLTLIRMDLLRALLTGSLILVTGAFPFPQVAQLIALYSIIFVTSSCSQFFSPARLTLLGDIVTESQRTSAFSLQQVTQSLTTLIGPPLAVPLLFAIGIKWLLFIDAVSFCLSLLAIAAIRAPIQQGTHKQSKDFRREFLQGIYFAFKEHAVRNLLLGIFIAALGGGAINALNIFFLIQNLHVPVKWLGFFDAVFSIGIIGGVLLMGKVARRIGLELAFSSGVFAIGIGLIVLARLTNLWLAFGVIALLGASQGIISVSTGPLMLQFTPRELLGRVVSVMNPLPILASLISATLAGYLASTVLYNLHAFVFGIAIGPIDTIFTGAGILMTIAGIYLLKSQKRVKTVHTKKNSIVPIIYSESDSTKHLL